MVFSDPHVPIEPPGPPDVFSSSGGVGDALIVALKMSFPWYVPRLWVHHEKHDCHARALEELVGFFWPKVGWVKMCKEPYIEALKMVGARHVIPPVDQEVGSHAYLSSDVSTVNDPYIEDRVARGVRAWGDPYHLGRCRNVCVQKHAGRLGDSTRREVSNSMIEMVAKRLPKRNVFVLGQESCKVPNFRNVINLTGLTPSLIEAFDVVENCDLFIGQDGVLAYYALMRRKPTVINYHDPRLVNQYWNEKWLPHGFPCFMGNNLMVNDASKSCVEAAARMVCL